MRSPDLLPQAWSSPAEDQRGVSAEHRESGPFPHGGATSPYEHVVEHRRDRPSRSFSVLLVDGDRAHRAALAAIVKADARLRLAGEADDLARGIEAASALSPDVAVIELALAATNSELLSAVARASPATRILLVAEDAESDVVRSLIASGVMGYLEKDAPRMAVAAAIVTVAAGEAAVSAAMLAKLVSTAPALGGGPESLLTPREREVGALAAMGYPNAEIAERLYVSPATVKTHLASVYRKLGVSGRTAAAAKLMRTANQAPVQVSTRQGGAG
jgi:DNA-binding NarL/FixJ family response regulator